MPTKIKIQTNHGDIFAELFSDDAINTVKNFVTLAQSGYYDGLTFHRVV
ncbi:MAG: peptidylprolyl isomerase, partial [Candidatus Thorarchaeota archaeon]|nr:peptidylprolyl isomerase [Candidatus Thorarchaeota archaeon]